MKAITLWQPWASLIADGIKRIETRPRPWYFIGNIAIHAGLHVDHEACKRFGYGPDTIPRGVIVAVAYKNGCVKFPDKMATPDAYGDFTPGRYGYLFNKILRIKEPIPARGSQGFWQCQLPDTLCDISGFDVTFDEVMAPF